MILFAFTLGLKTAPLWATELRVELPVAIEAPQLRFAAILGDADDKLLASENAGQCWREVFRGRIESLQLPLRREVALAFTRGQVLPPGRETTFMDVAEEQFEPEQWRLSLQSPTATVIITSQRAFTVPPIGRVRQSRLLDSGQTPEHHFQVLSVKGSRGAGTFLFLDDRAVLNVADDFTTDRLGAKLSEQRLEFTNPAQVARYHLETLTVSDDGVAKFLRSRRIAARLRELRGEMDNPDGELERLIYRQLFDDPLLLNRYLPALGSQDREHLERSAKTMIRDELFEIMPMLRRIYTSNERWVFEGMIQKLAVLWMQGEIRFHPLTRQVGRELSRPCVDALRTRKLKTSDVLADVTPHFGRLRRALARQRPRR